MTNLQDGAAKLLKSYITMEDMMSSVENLKDIIKNTELIESKVFSKETGNRIFIKPENLQVTGAFKIRGAFNKVSKLSSLEKSRGIITSSAGNHAQGVAYAAQILGIKAVIVMPETTPLIKVESTRSYGAEIVLYGDNYDEAYNKARELEKENNYIFVHPFDDMDVIIGQGTIAYEIIRDLENVDEIVVPVGGGGLISGIAITAKMLKPNIRIIGVEPEGAACIKASLENHKLTELSKVDTIADGTAVKKPGQLTFDIIRDYVDEIITVSDFEIMEAILILMEKHKLVAEGAGALSLAALKKIKSKDKNIVAVVSGGNIDISTISAMINKALVSRGRLFCFTVNLPDKPGVLLNVAKILADLNANVIKLDHNQSKVIDRFKQVQLEVTVETNGFSHVEAIVSALEENGYIIDKIY